MKVVFLIVITWFAGNGRYVYVHEFPTWEACLQAVHTARVDVSHGAESEGMAIAYCAPQKP